jgi:hypothetical protein
MVEDEDAGVVYNTRQAAEALGVGSAMMRRYAQTLEEIMGEEIPQTRRDGRQFTHEHLGILLRAKSLVDSHNGLSVEAALRMATSTTGDAEGLPVGVPMGSIADSATLIAALQEAITAPLVAELRELRADRNDVQALRNEVAALLSELAETRSLPPGANAERIDRALEVELLENIAPLEHPATSEDSDTAAERPGDGSGTADGLLVRAARWLERRLR